MSKSWAVLANAPGEAVRAHWDGLVVDLSPRRTHGCWQFATCLQPVPQFPHVLPLASSPPAATDSPGGSGLPGECFWGLALLWAWLGLGDCPCTLGTGW